MMITVHVWGGGGIVLFHAKFMHIRVKYVRVGNDRVGGSASEKYMVKYVGG